MMNMTFNGEDTSGPARNARPIPVAVQILSILLFAAFAISVSITAMTLFWPAGIALAVLFAWQWARIPTLSGGFDLGRTVDALRPELPESGLRPSGNASFDAYRHDMLNRLEQEQDHFVAFLGRLRDAKDRMEFDRFMDDRAARIDSDESRAPHYDAA